MPESPSTSAPRHRSSGRNRSSQRRNSSAPAPVSPDVRAMRLLEWPRVLSRLENLASCEPGRDLVRALEPTRDHQIVRRALQITDEARHFLRDTSHRGAANLPFGSISDISSALQRARIGSVLDAPELNRIKRVAESARRIAQVLAEADDEEFRPPQDQRRSWEIDPDEKIEIAPASTCGYYLRALALQIEAQPQLEKRLDDAIDEASEDLRDNASLDLLKARRNIRNTQDAVQSRLRAMLSDPSIAPALQDAFVTVRNGRYCLPVKSDARGRVPGIVHDRSGGGGTLFVEPQSVVDLNNQLREWQLAERDAIDAILRALSAEVAAVADELETMLDICAQLDFAFAKGRLSLAMDGSAPKINPRPIYNLKQARHPLIENCIANDIRLGDEFDVLMITGPNTGGKTVVMKTLGLSCLMTMCGLHIAALPGSEIYLPRAIWADIGDEQSIEQSLSTFSSHMTNIIAILNGARADDLVMFDEIGAGTDPDEGAALAKAILRNLQRRGAQILCTTHYGELKHFSAGAERFENASVEFDAQTLGPTYRLRIGVPGSSNALDTTARLGMNTELVQRARKYLGRDRELAETAAQRLEETQRELEQQAEGVSREREEIERLRRDYENRVAKLQAQLEREREEARVQAAALVKNAEREADAALKELRQAARAGRESKATETARGRLRDLRERTSANDQTQSQRDNQKAPQVLAERKRATSALPSHLESLKKGDLVRVKSLGREAILLSDPQGEKRVAVQVGAVKIDVNVADLDSIQAPTGASGGFNVQVRKGIKVADELNLIGKNTQEALPELEKYLDDALLSDTKEIRIVHGKGSGVLRTFVRRWLQDQGSVREVEYAPQNQGGEGATLAKLG